MQYQAYMGGAALPPQQQAKFPIRQGLQPVQTNLADSVTSLNLSQGSLISAPKPADPRTSNASSMPAARVRPATAAPLQMPGTQLGRSCP